MSKAQTGCQREGCSINKLMRAEPSYVGALDADIASRLLALYITNSAAGADILEFIRQSSDMPIADAYRLLYVPAENPYDALSSIRGVLGKEEYALADTRTDGVIVLIGAKSADAVKRCTQAISKVLDMEDIFAVAGEYVPTENLAEQYKEVISAVNYRFYKKNGLIYASSVDFKALDAGGFDFFVSEYMPKTSYTDEIMIMADKLCAALMQMCVPPDDARCLFRRFINSFQSIKDAGIRYLKTDAFETVEDFRAFMSDYIKEIERENGMAKRRTYSATIKETIRIIEENISNEKLSLRWLAGNILYTNVDYLGKLFKKETGMNFSHYVMQTRMELAKKLILDGTSDKIYEIAEKVGFGSNSQYFSQVFKKYTGISPLEYKEFVRGRRKHD